MIKLIVTSSYDQCVVTLPGEQIGCDIVYDQCVCEIVIYDQCVVTFQAIKEAIDVLQPALESAESQRENALNRSSAEQAASIRSLIEKLRNEWKQLNSQYQERHR